MKDSYASKWQRFVAFIIDMIIVYSFSFLLLFLAYKIFDYTSNREALWNTFAKDFKTYSQNAGSNASSIYYNKAMDSFSAFLKVYLLETLYSTICIFLIGSLYLVLLPLLTNFQTIGRLVARIKVVRTDGDKPRLTNLLMRELLGALVLQSNLICLIVSIILAIKKNGSVIDYISRCRLVQKTFDKRIMELEEIKDNEEGNQEINIYPDSEILNEDKKEEK